MRPHRGLFTWTFIGTYDMYDRLNRFARKFSHVGLFNFRVQADGTITGQVLPLDEQARLAHPEIEWYLTIRNDGYRSIFTALVTDPSARSTFLAEIARLLDTYPWVSGIDLDLERGPNEYRSQTTDLFRAVAGVVHARGKKLHADLPPKQGDHSPWWEEWCDYGALASILDTCLIMTYGFAWAGSAVGPITPRSWLEATYDYAVTRFRPEQIFMGLPAYGFRWRLDKTPQELGRTYRGVGGPYLPFLDWMQGTNTHTDGLHDGQPATETQPHIAWAGIWDEENWQTRGLFHVYDVLDARDFSLTSPAASDRWGNRYYFTSARKDRLTTFEGVAVDRAGDSYDDHEGAVIVEPYEEHWAAVVHPRVWHREDEYIATGNGRWETIYDPVTGEPVGDEWVGLTTFMLDFAPVVPGSETIYLNGRPTDEYSLDYDTGLLTFYEAPAEGVDITATYDYTEVEGRALYNLNVAQGGMYDLALLVSFPWFDKRQLAVELDGERFIIGGPGVVEQWYPLFQVPHWIVVARRALSAGSHTFRLLGTDLGSDPGVRLYRIVLASAVTQEVVAGSGSATVHAQPLVDRDGNPAYPHQNRFRVALEWLRRAPDPAPIWGTRWTEYPLGALSNPAYRIAGNWRVEEYVPTDVGSGTGNQDPEVGASEGSGSTSGSRAVRGLGTLDLDYDGFMDLVVTANVVPGGGTTRCGVSHAGYRAALESSGRVVLFDGTRELASAPAAYAPGVLRTLRLRLRNDLADVWVDGEHVLGPVAVAPRAGSAGLFAEGGEARFTAFLVGDAHWYMPMEAIRLRRPDGVEEVIGRVDRSGVQWNEWGYFRLTDESREELDTRTERFSLDWDYAASQTFALAPGAYPLTVRFEDPGVWVARVYLGDADGFSEACWADWETHRRYADLAHYRWGLAGTGFWALGMEDPKLLPHLPDQT